MFKVEIKNVNDFPYLDNWPYVVARLVDKEFWFWGAFETEAKANDCANAMENAIVFKYEKGE